MPKRKAAVAIWNYCSYKKNETETWQVDTVDTGDEHNKLIQPFMPGAHSYCIYPPEYFFTICIARLKDHNVSLFPISGSRSMHFHFRLSVSKSSLSFNLKAAWAGAAQGPWRLRIEHSAKLLAPGQMFNSTYRLMWSVKYYHSNQ